MKASDLRGLYQDRKLSISKIAKIYGCSYTTVWKRMEKFSIKPRTLSEANKLNMLTRKIDIPVDQLKDLYKRQKLSVLKIARLFNCHHSTILDRMKEYHIKRRNLTEANTLFRKKNFSDDLKRKAYLIGFRTGDLYVTRISKNGKTLRIEGSSTRNEQIDHIKSLFSKYGRVKKGNFIGFKGQNFKRISCLVNDSFRFLLEKKDSIEPWILEDNDYFWSFVAGYVDAEGHIGIHGYGKTRQVIFSLCSSDRVILRQIYEYFLKMGINAKLRISHPAGYKSSQKKKPYKRDYWALNVHSKLSLLRLFDFLALNLEYPLKIKSLQKARNNIQERNRKFGYLRMEAKNGRALL